MAPQPITYFTILSCMILAALMGMILSGEAERYNDCESHLFTKYPPMGSYEIYGYEAQCASLVCGNYVAWNGGPYYTSCCKRRFILINAP